MLPSRGELEWFLGVTAPSSRSLVSTLSQKKYYRNGACMGSAYGLLGLPTALTIDTYSETLFCTTLAPPFLQISICLSLVNLPTYFLGISLTGTSLISQNRLRARGPSQCFHTVEYFSLEVCSLPHLLAVKTTALWASPVQRSRLHLITVNSQSPAVPHAQEADGVFLAEWMGKPLLTDCNFILCFKVAFINLIQG